MLSIFNVQSELYFSADNQKPVHSLWKMNLGIGIFFPVGGYIKPAKSIIAKRIRKFSAHIADQT